MLTKEQRISDSQIDDLDAAHDGRIAHVYMNALPRRKGPPPAGSVEWEVVCRAPSRLEMQAFKAASSKNKVTAEEDLVRSTVIAVAGGGDKPPAVALDEVIERFAGLPGEVAKHLVVLSGMSLGDLGNG